MARAQWGSRLGFILAAAGSAIGLGAVWKFPYVAANNGGGVFLFIYLFFCITLGLLLMVTEVSLGRLSAASPVGAFRKNGGKLWSLVGYSSVLTCFLIMSFYSVVGGWTVAYLVKAATGSLAGSGATATEFTEQFTHFISSPLDAIFYYMIFTALTVGIVIGGVQKGIENLAKYLMPGLFVLLLVLVGRALTLNGAIDGVIYFITPDFGKVTPAMLIDALGLALFSLSLGMGIMLTYGSYVSKSANLFSSSIWVISLTILMCFLSGLMILPAVFAFGFNPAAGPGLTFVTMPAIFSQMPMGGFFATLFFVLLLVAALTSSISILEVLVSFLIDEFHINRRRATILAIIMVIIPGIPCTLSFGAWDHVLIFGKTFFDLFDYLTSNLMMPLNEILLAIFVGWYAWPKVEADLSGSGRFLVLLPVVRFFLRFVVPVLIGIILIRSL